jgi:uncharacterized protein
MHPVEGAKILFTGPTGAGKTTAIHTLSGSASPVAAQSGHDGPPVPFDYGEFQPEGGAALRLYGAPEQMRFDFMWKVLADDAAGLVVLLDHERPDPAADALRYVQSFDALVRRTACVVGIGRFNLVRAPGLHVISSRLLAAGYRVPVLEVDVRRQTDMLRLMRALTAPGWLDAGITAPGPLTAPHLLPG